MAFTVQDDLGSVVGANAYISYAFFQQYHADRANSLTGHDQDACQAAIVKATTYVDGRFKFRGAKRTYEQTTQWPRYDAWNDDGRALTDLPVPLKNAVAEYAFRALTADLMADPDIDSTGQAVQSKTEQVGPISESITYVTGAAYRMPKYPVADRILISGGLVRSGREIVRG
jgi:hypothetical protein